MSESKNMPIEMSNSEYHAHPALGKSRLDMINKDPHSLVWANQCARDDKKMENLDFGDAMHAICLESWRLKAEFAAMPEVDGRTKEGKAIKEAFYAENKGKKILSADDFKKLELMYDSVMSHPQARDLLEAAGVNEGSYFWTDKETGLELKCRPDREIESRGLLIDIKTTDSLKKFAYAVEDYRYHVQDSFYCDGVGNFKDKPRMLFLVIQKTIDLGRYPVHVWELPEEAKMEGRRCYQADLRKYARFLESGKPLHSYDELQMSYKFIDMCMENMEVGI